MSFKGQLSLILRCTTRLFLVLYIPLVDSVLSPRVPGDTDLRISFNEHTILSSKTTSLTERRFPTITVSDLFLNVICIFRTYLFSYLVKRII